MKKIIHKYYFIKKFTILKFTILLFKNYFAKKYSIICNLLKIILLNIRKF